MIKRINVYILLICGVLLSSCDGNNNLMPNAINLNEIDRKQINDYCAFDCAIIDTMIVVHNGCGKKWMSLYSINSLNYIDDFGEKGNLPGELLMPQIIKDASLTSSNFMIGDTNLGKLYKFDLHNILRANSESVVLQNSEVKLPNDLLLTMDISMVSKEQFAYISVGDKDNFFYIYNTNNNSKKAIDIKPNYDYPKINQKLIAYTGAIYANSQKEVIAIAFKHLDMVNFYTKKGELIKSTKLSKVKKPIISENFSTELVIHNNLIYGTTEYLYVQKIDATMPEIKNAKIKSNEILKFDWDGNLLNRYKIPVDIATFCVDEKNNSIYTIAHTENAEYAEIIKFSMI